MDDLITARQLQELLQIDRITVYRMLSAGRLKGFKVGGQWRFSRREIDKWLQDQQLAPEDVAAAGGEPDAPGASPFDMLPISCVIKIQDIFAEAADIGVVTVAPEGQMISDPSNACAFCRLILSSPLGQQRCSTAWLEPNGSDGFHTCHAGLLCTNAPVVLDGQVVATVAGCGFAPAHEGDSAPWEVGVPALAAELELDESALRAAGASVRVLGPTGLARIPHLIQRVAGTFAEIGHERLGFVNRLKRIAEMTHL